MFGNAGEDIKMKKLMNADLSLEALLAMDEDGDGEITEYEFLRFMLVQCEMADAAVLEMLHEKFCELDEDGSGALDADDLKIQPCGSKPLATAAAVVAARNWWNQEAALVRQ